MTSATKTRNILVVDDNPGDIGLISQVIDGIPGLVLHIAHNVTYAHAYLNGLLPCAQSPIPDLILLDLRMPLISGESVIPLVRREPRLQQVKIVMFTSSARPEDREQCEALGADGYVIKPGDWDQWKATINRILAQYGLLDPHYDS